MADLTPEQRAADILPPDIFHESPAVEMREVIASAIRAAEEAAEARGRLAAAELFDRLDVIAETPNAKVSDADRTFYHAMSAHFEPIGRSVLPNWEAIAAAIRSGGENG